MSHETASLVSIIIAVFNGKATLQQCIDSIELQTYSNRELIIIDGGSTDGTVGLLQENAERISYWISEPDRGIYSAWNKGLAIAKGEWICFLGADDYLWDSSVLERVAGALKLLSDKYRVAYGQIMLVGIDGNPISTIGQAWEEVRESFKQQMSIPHVGAMHRRSLFERHGIFDESFHIAGDYELLLRELKTAEAVFLPNIIVAGQRLGGVSTDTKNYFRIELEVRRAQRMHDPTMQRGAMLKELLIEKFQLALWWVFGEKCVRRLFDLQRRLKSVLR